jgi:hypothetical protein
LTFVVVVERWMVRTPLSTFLALHRFDLAVRQIVRKRITYKELTGKEGETGF